MSKYEILNLGEGVPEPVNPELVLYYPHPAATTVFSEDNDEAATNRFDMGFKDRERVEANLAVFTTVGTAVVATRQAQIDGKVYRWALVKECSEGHPDGLSLKLFRDGDQLCMLYGPNLQEGIAGFGPNLPAAFADFHDNLMASEEEIAQDLVTL